MMMTMDQPSSSGFGDTLSNFGGGFSSDHYGSAASVSSSPSGDPDVDWSVFENAERYLLRDDSAWITRLSKDFWWNLERISEMITSEFALAQQMNNNNNGASGGLFARPPIPSHTINKFNSSQTSVQQQQQQVPSAQQHFMQPPTGKSSGNFNQPVAPPPMQFGGVPPRKIVGQRSMPSQMSASNHQFRSGTMFSNGLASPPPSSSSSSSSGSTIVRPAHNNNNNNNIPDKFNPSTTTNNNLFQAFSSMSMGNGGNVNGNNDLDVEYNPFQSKISFDNNMWGNNSQQPISWQ